MEITTEYLEMNMTPLYPLTHALAISGDGVEIG